MKSKLRASPLKRLLLYGAGVRGRLPHRTRVWLKARERDEVLLLMGAKIISSKREEFRVKLAERCGIEVRERLFFLGGSEEIRIAEGAFFLFASRKSPLSLPFHPWGELKCQRGFPRSLAFLPIASPPRQSSVADTKALLPLPTAALPISSVYFCQFAREEREAACKSLAS